MSTLLNTVPFVDTVAVKFPIPLEAVALWRFASDDSNRPQIGGVLLETKDNYLTAVATNGHSLVKTVTHLGNNNTHTKLDGVSFLIPAEAFKNIEKEVKAAKKAGQGVLFSVDVVCGVQRKAVPVAKFTTNTGETRFNLLSETFPNWRKLVPEANKKGDAQAVGINPRYIGDLHTYLKATGNGDFGVCIDPITDGLSPIRITVPSKEALGFEFEAVIMPMRM